MKITLVPYNPKWPVLFQVEAKLIKEVLAIDGLRIEHIGSTAISELSAKPVIDIMIGLLSFDHMPSIINALKSLDYEYRPNLELEMPNRRFFSKAKNQKTTHQIHMVKRDSEFWNRHLFFRDYLRTHDSTRQDYEMLKHKLALQNWDSVDDYAQAKSGFIRSIEGLNPDITSKI